MSEDFDKYNENIDDYDKFKDMKSGMNRLHVDSLGELGNIGAGASLRALSKFLNREVSMSLPYIHEIPANDLKNKIIFNKDLYNEEEVAFISVEVCKPHPFYMICIITKPDSHKLLSIIFPNLKEVESINDYSLIQKSLLKEIGSILIIQYIVAINKLLGVEHEVHAPILNIGKISEIISDIYNGETFEMGINLNIFTLENKVYFDLTILPTGNTINEFLKLMGVKD